LTLNKKIRQLTENNIAIIDLRTADNFIEMHLKGSCSLPWGRLPQSMHELPANHIPLALLGNITQLEEAEQFLLSKGYQIIDKIIADESFLSDKEIHDLLERGRNSRQLWQANPLLSEIIDRVEDKVVGRTAIDLAAGAGRDSVYLAKRGWQVTSIDINPDSLQRCSLLSQSNQVKLTTLQRDLENSSHPLSDLSADMVLVMRYLHRPLFPAIDQLIRPGGVIIYSTFMVGCERYGSPRNPNYLLKAGELAETFSTYQTIIDEQRKLADGRPVALYAGLKPKVS